MYPEDFIKAAKVAFPDWQELHRAIDAGDQGVGEMLSVRRGPISLHHTITLLEEGRSDQLLGEARHAKAAETLLSRWFDTF